MSQLSFTKEKLKDLLIEHYPRLKNVREKLVDNKLNPFSYLIETIRASGNNYHHNEAGFFVDLGKNQTEKETIALLVPVSQEAKQQKINNIIPLIISLGIFEFLQIFANKFTKNIRFIFHNTDLMASGKLLIENNALQNVTQLYILNSNGMIPANSIAITRKIVIPASEKFQIKIYNDEAA